MRPHGQGVGKIRENASIRAITGDICTSCLHCVGVSYVLLMVGRYCENIYDYKIYLINLIFTYILEIIYTHIITSHITFSLWCRGKARR